jgi:hypothetical protein
MRSFTLVSRGTLAALLVALGAAGCTGHEASGQEAPVDTGQPAASRISGEELVPGEQRLPGPPTVTTAIPRRPIARTSSPAVTTTSIAPAPAPSSVGGG